MAIGQETRPYCPKCHERHWTADPCWMVGMPTPPEPVPVEPTSYVTFSFKTGMGNSVALSGEMPESAAKKLFGAVLDAINAK